MDNVRDSSVQDYYEFEEFLRFRRSLRDGVPCGKHPNCLNHVKMPCEGCGRKGGRFDDVSDVE